MKVLTENKFSNVFPMRVTCKRVVNEFGFSYGKKKDFCGSELEIDAGDIKRHIWHKYPDFFGEDYGVICPICGGFIPLDKRDIPVFVMNKAETIIINKTSRLPRENSGVIKA